MKEKSSGRDRNEKVKIAQSNNSIYGGLSFSGIDNESEGAHRRYSALGQPTYSKSQRNHLASQPASQFNVAFYFSRSCELVGPAAGIDSQNRQVLSQEGGRSGNGRIQWGVFVVVTGLCRVHVNP